MQHESMIFMLVRQIYIKTLDVTVVVKDMIMPKLTRVGNSCHEEIGTNRKYRQD